MQRQKVDQRLGDERIESVCCLCCGSHLDIVLTQALGQPAMHPAQVVRWLSFTVNLATLRIT